MQKVIDDTNEGSISGAVTGGAAGAVTGAVVGAVAGFGVSAAVVSFRKDVCKSKFKNIGNS
ncbi:hypothetical protein [Bartonella sp. DGB1]|uniref:hypothetical protein n=1 Tax=Bartonella sp. DGB1 TaxID=3239807 RepID=UPI0035232BD1